MSASRLAKILDQEMIEGAGIDIASARTPPEDLPVRAGTEVSAELGGRLLIRYMLGPQLGKFAGGSTDRHFVTPTPLSSDEAGAFLALPRVAEPRLYAMLIDPAAVAEVQGPHWVRGGDGIEYVLPKGFPSNAVLLGWEIEVT